jgi:hypothetical protein
MTTSATRAARLDDAVDAVLAGGSAAVAAAASGVAAVDRPLVDLAAAMRSALAPSLVAPRFEARLGARLAGVGGTPWILRHPGRLIVTGAVGSAVGVGVTAYAVWRSRTAHRLLHR